jgi:6-phosphogluconolactonase
MAPNAGLVSRPATECLPQITIGSVAELADLVRGAVRTAANASAAAARPFRLAVSGGAVASQILPALRMDDAHWAASGIWWVDERVVPVESAESNAGEAIRGWMASSGALAAQAHSMAGVTAAPDAVAREYDAALRAALGDHGMIDLAILGVGEDGHVCSLFPGHAALEEQHAWVVCEHASPKPPPVRLTWTLPVFTRVRRVCVVALGTAKASAMGRVHHQLIARAPVLPLARLLQASRTAHWMLDHGAAAQFPVTEPVVTG